MAVLLVPIYIISRFYQFDRSVFCLIGKIKNAFQLLSEMRYGNYSAQTNSSSQQHFAGIVPGTVVEIVPYHYFLYQVLSHLT